MSTSVNGPMPQIGSRRSHNGSSCVRTCAMRPAFVGAFNSFKNISNGDSAMRIRLKGDRRMDPETVEVFDYVFADRARLDLALMIAQSYDGLRQTIRRRFPDRIAGTVRAELGPRWQVAVRTQDRPDITLRKPSWPAERFLFLGQAGGRQILFGLRYKDATSAQNDALKVALDGALGTSHPHHEYWLWLPDAIGWRDWSDRKTLLDVHSSETRIDYWTDSLLRMARAVEPIADEHAPTT